MTKKPEPGRGEPDFTDEKIAARQRNADEEPPPLTIGEQKPRHHWSRRPTAAEKRGAPQIVPPAMWARIADARAAVEAGEIFSFHDALVRIADNFGFTYSELIACGILAPPPDSNPSALKGARR